MEFTTDRYVLESGNLIERVRYLELQKRLAAAGYDGRREGVSRGTLRRENPELCEAQVLDMFKDAAPVFGNAIHEQLRYLGHSIKTSRRTLRSLQEKGILCREGRSYRLLDSNGSAPMEVGAPIVFLPGTRSQQTGHVVEMKELKSGLGGVYPIASLSSGQTLFVSPETAKVDLSQKSLEECLQWLLRALGPATSKETAMSAADVCRKAYEDGIPKASSLIKIAVRGGEVKRGYKRFPTYIESIYWRTGDR